MTPGFGVSHSLPQAPFGHSWRCMCDTAFVLFSMSICYFRRFFASGFHIVRCDSFFLVHVLLTVFRWHGSQNTTKPIAKCETYCQYFDSILLFGNFTVVVSPLTHAQNNSALLQAQQPKWSSFEWRFA